MRSLSVKLFLFGCVLCFGWVRAYATTISASPPALVTSGNTATLVDDVLGSVGGDFSRIMNMPSNAAALEVTDTVALATEAGEVGVTVVEAGAAEAVVGAVVACVASVVCGAVAAVAALAVAARLKSDGHGGLLGDAGQAQASVPGVEWKYGGGPWASTPDGAVQAVCAANGWRCTINGWSYDGLTATSSGTIADPGGAWSNGASFSVSGRSTTVQQCPADSSGNTPSPGADGMCPTGVYAPVSATQAAQILSQQGLHAQLESAVKDGISQGGMQIPSTPVSMTGPASISGPATVTSTTTATDAAGHTSTSTTTSSPSLTFQYYPDHITETGSTTTTVTNSDGSTSSTVTPGTPGTTGNGTGSGTQDQPDMCKFHPDVVACQKLGDPGTDAPTWTNKTITFAPEDLGLPSGCPASRSFTVRGIAFVTNYQPACDVAPVISVGLIALTAVSCALWIMSSIKG